MLHGLTDLVKNVFPQPLFNDYFLGKLEEISFGQLQNHVDELLVLEAPVKGNDVRVRQSRV